MLTGIKTQTGKLVFCFLNGKHCMPLVLPIVQANRDISFYFHSRNFAGVDFLASPLSKFPNAHFVGDFDELKFKLNLFGLFITTDANAAHAHVYSLKLVSMFRALGIPVLELQHGLFQIGLHYYDVPSSSSFAGDSLPSKSFAVRVLAYYPPINHLVPYTVIGYPPYSGKSPANSAGSYLLILSNLHWQTYTESEKMAFYEAVVRFAEEHPEIPVVWKMHHGETPVSSTSNKKVQSILGRHPAASAHIRFAHLDAELKDKTAAEVISGAKYVVSSVSTVLLDCEIYRRPIAVYGCDTNACLIKMLEDVAVFRDYDSLVALFDKGLRPIRSGKLRPYDNKAFRAVLNKMYKPSAITSMKFLQLLMSQTFRDDFIARNMAAKDAAISVLKKSDDMKSGTIATLRNEVASATKEREELASERNAICDERKALRDELSRAMKENGSVSAERDAIRDERDALRDELAKTQKETGSVSAERDALRDELAKVAMERTRLDAALLERDARCDRKDTTIEKYARQIGTLEGDCAALAEQKNRLEQKYDSVAAECDALRLQLSACQTKIQAQESERNVLREDFATMKSLVEDRIASCDKIRKELMEQNARLGKERAEVQKKLAASEQRVMARQHDLQQMEQMLAKAQQTIKALKDMQASRTLRKRFNRLVKGLLPYGVTCTWKRMAYGIVEDRPLFAYPGFLKRIRRLVKFTLPYFLVMAFRRVRYGRAVQ